MNKNIHDNSNDFWKEYSKREDLTLNSLMNLEANAEKSKTKFQICILQIKSKY